MWNIDKIISCGKYNYVLLWEHPFCTKNGYVFEHRVVMENFLERLLNADEIVHHVDNDGKNNVIENLDLCLKPIHSKFHGYHKGRKFVELKCPNCGVVFHKPKNASFLQKGSKYTCCSSICRGKFSKEIQAHGKTHKVELAISRNLIREYRKYSASGQSIST